MGTVKVLPAPARLRCVRAVSSLSDRWSAERIELDLRMKMGACSYELLAEALQLLRFVDNALLALK